jgi:hypothetical protein
LKKVFGLILFCFIVCLVGCAEKDRFVTPLMTVAIDPIGKVVIATGADKTLSAVVRDASGNFTNQPVQWSINNTSVGEFSSTTSMNTTFTASAPGDAVITLTCLGISSTVEVTVS